MTKDRFTELTGMVVSDAEYAHIREMYVYCPLIEEEFCEDFKKHGDSLILQYYYLHDKHLKEVRENLMRERTSLAYDLIKKSFELNDESLTLMAIGVLGEREYIHYKLSRDMILSEFDRNLLIKFTPIV